MFYLLAAVKDKKQTSCEGRLTVNLESKTSPHFQQGKTKNPLRGAQFTLTRRLKSAQGVSFLLFFL